VATITAWGCTTGCSSRKTHRGGRLAQRRDRGCTTQRSGLTVEVEVESAAEFEEALNARPDLIMLDDFGPADLQAR